MRKKIKLFVVLGLLIALTVNLYSAEKTLIRIGVCTGGTDIRATQAQINEYMKLHPDVKVEIIPLSQDATEVLAYFLQLMETKSGDMDILPVDTVWIGELAPALVNFDKAKVKKLTDKMFPILIKSCEVNGKLVALPWYATPSVLYYRKDLLKKYNLPIPKTWTDLTRTAYKIQEGERAAANPDFVGYVWQGLSYEGLTCNALEWIVSNGGGSIVSEDKIVTINNKNARQALDCAASWVGTISPAGVTSMKEEGARALFQSGNAAFMRNWPYAYVLCQGKNSMVKGKIGICPLPAGNSGKSADVLGANMIGVNKYSKHIDIAKDVAMFLLSEKMQKNRTVLTGYGPTIMSLYHDKDLLKINPGFKDLSDAFAVAVNRPSTVTAPHYSRVSKEFYSAVYKVLTGEIDSETALSNLAEKVSKITGYPILKNKK